MSRLVDADVLISDLEYDIKMDQESLDYEDLSDVNRKLIQNDKDIKQNVVNILENTQTVDAVPVVHGHWVESGFNGFDRCSNCKAIWDVSLTKRNRFFRHCPKCGATMDEVTE